MDNKTKLRIGGLALLTTAVLSLIIVLIVDSWPLAILLAVIIVAAAAGVLAHNAEELKRFIKGRLQAQDADPEKLGELIESAQTQIKQIRKIRRKIEGELSTEFKTALGAIDDLMKKSEGLATDIVAQLLEDGKLDLNEFVGRIVYRLATSQRWYLRLPEDIIKKKMDSWIKCLPDDYNTCLSIIRKLEGKGDFHTLEEMGQFLTEAINHPALETEDETRQGRKKRRFGYFSNTFIRLFGAKGIGEIYKSRKAAENAKNEIASRIKDILNEAGRDVGIQINKASVALSERMLELQKEIEKQISDFSEKADAANLEALTFNMPSHAIDWTFDAPDEAEQVDFINMEIETTVVSRKQDGFWGGLKRSVDLFGFKWGYDEVTEKEEYARLDTEKLKSYWKSEVTQALQNLREQVQDDFMQPLENSFNDFFAQIQQCFEQVQDSLQKGLRDQQEREEEERMAIRAELQNLQQQHTSGPEDAASLNQWASDQLEKHAAALARE